MLATNTRDQQFFTASKNQLLPVAGGMMSVSVVKPQQYGPFPAVLLCMGMYGVNDQLQSVATLLSERGFIVFVPDLYHHMGGVSPYQPENFDEALDAMHLLGDDRCLGDIECTLAMIRARRDVCGGGVAVVGLCMGGKWSMLSALEFSSSLACASSFYPAGLESSIDKLVGLKVPVQFIVAGKDIFSGAQTLAALKKQLARFDVEHQVVTYAEADHNFLDSTQPGYDPVIAAKALHEAQRFFARHIQVAVD